MRRQQPLRLRLPSYRHSPAEAADTSRLIADSLHCGIDVVIRKTLRAGNSFSIRLMAKDFIPAAEPIGSPETSDLKVTQALSSEQRISASQDEDAPRSPGNGYSRALEGNRGMRPAAEHAVSERDPRRDMMSRVPEARQPE